MPFLLPVTANMVCRFGNDVLLIRRSQNARVWPNFWAFPGGKLEEGELLRETAIREASEEIGVYVAEENIEAETCVMVRSVEGTKLVYMCMTEQWDGTPEILESHLASDIAWFSMDNLPEPMIPYHRQALRSLEQGESYSEFDTAP